jgi:metallo-beta-lactamase family protein
MIGKITFCGGVEGVTGANFLYESAAGSKIIIDCGMFQGNRVAEAKNREPFPYPVEEISAVFITHAHLDHIGRLPLLIKAGYKGPIYSTPPTREIAELSLADSLGVLEKEARQSGEPLPYHEADVAAVMTHWRTLNYHQPLKLGELAIHLRNAGHILGSAMVVLEEGGLPAQAGKRIIFTGDLGNSPSPLLPPPDSAADADYLIIESVYGDRNHPPLNQTETMLEDVIEETMAKGGTLLIPAFSIERTQALLYQIENMMEVSRIPVVPVYLDSPLAIRVTGVYRKYTSYFSEAVNDIERLGDGIFRFPQLVKTLTTQESREIDKHPERKIIIAGSGMSNGGRIIHHEKKYLPDPKSALIIAGYQAAGSLGRLLSEGVTPVTILGESVNVNARVVNLTGYSAHMGADDLLEFIGRGAGQLKTVWVVMGEPQAAWHLVQRAQDYLGIKAVAPTLGQTVTLD